jgi:hypothetical protein
MRSLEQEVKDRLPQMGGTGSYCSMETAFPFAMLKKFWK